MWFEHEVKPRLRGQRVPRPLRGRLRHRLRVGGRRAPGDGRAAEAIREVRPDAAPGEDAAGRLSTGRAAGRATTLGRGPGRFDLLGFTHYWGRSRKGNWVVKRKTAREPLQSRAQAASREWCREHRHLPIARAARRRSTRSCAGTTATTASPGTARRSSASGTRSQRIWRKWLDRRSQRARMTWERFDALAAALPASAAARRPQRLPPRSESVTEEPDAGNPHVRICGSPGRNPRGDPTAATQHPAVVATRSWRKSVMR